MNAIDAADGIQVPDARLPDCALAVCTGKQLLVCTALTNRVRDEIASVRVEVRLLDRTHEDVRMLAKVVVERRGTGFGGADDEEVRERHVNRHPLIR